MKRSHYIQKKLLFGVQDFTDGQKNVRMKRAKELLGLHESGQLPNLVFSNEKPFQIEQFLNKQNHRIYLPKMSAENLHLRLATTTQAPPMAILWTAVKADGRCPLVFIDRGDKLNAEYYRDNVLKRVLKPWADKHFDRRPWTFQRDSAPSHSARVNQEWLKK